MGNTARGNSGQSAEMVMDDKFFTIGTDPNVLPALSTDPTGKAINNYGVTGSSGAIKIDSAIPANTPIDNSGDFHGGTFSIVAMNKVNLTAGNGGFDISTGGNIAIASWGGVLNIIGTAEANVTGELVKINSTNTTMLNGPTLYVNTDETIFDKNVIFGNNALVNGGMVVNGELIAMHITTMRQVNMTESSETLFSYPIAGATFQCLITPMGMVTTPTIPLTPAVVLPGLAMITLMPTMNPITSIPPHKHLYNGPAVTLANGAAEMFSKMEQVENDKPIEANPTMPMDMPPGDLTDMLSSEAKEQFSSFASSFMA